MHTPAAQTSEDEIAGYKQHIGFYPGAATIAHFKTQLSQYKHAKGSRAIPAHRGHSYCLNYSNDRI